MNITKPQLKAMLKMQTDTEVARFFGTTKQAVCNWGDVHPIPEGRQWQAHALRPKVIPEPNREKVA